MDDNERLSATDTPFTVGNISACMGLEPRIASSVGEHYRGYCIDMKTLCEA